VVLLGAGILVATGLLALVLARVPRAATAVAAAGAVAAGALAAAAAVVALVAGGSIELAAGWAVPGGALVVGVDPLSAFFLLPLGLVGALCAVYGRRYLEGRVVPAAELNLLLAAMILVLVARHALLFLVAWEGMTLLAYVLVTHEHGEAEVRRAGWIYLVASHAAVSALLALFVALGARAGGALELAALAAAPSPSTAVSVLLSSLALIGFGIKAGVVGLHVWLPEAHAAAPSHVSALMSGVLVKLGLYGVLRVVLIVRPGAWLGVALMVLGVAGALYGIALAAQQRDLKRVLAYSTVENLGVILVGLGLGQWASVRGDGVLGALALGGALLHLWNHAAMKALLFFAAGSVLHAAGTKDVERLGGLLGAMPWTGRALLFGSVAIAALPPLNGFAGEWLLYQALARVGLEDRSAPALAALSGAAALALVGGLAALCFVRLAGAVLLGSPRSDGAARAHESPAALVAPMAVLAAACALAVLGAPALVSLHATVIGELHAAAATEVAGAARLLGPVVTISAALAATLSIAWLLLARRARRAVATETWGCGYAAPTARMQYTGRALSELLATRALPRWLRGRAKVRAPEGPFPAEASFVADGSDPLTRGLYEPFLARWGDRFARLRFLQQGKVHIYILYIVGTAVAVLAWVAVRQGWPP
jgi:formate hydrogenlyase subunit 3/multisubunit Na+/H+ antiporter MnhD subunit